MPLPMPPAVPVVMISFGLGLGDDLRPQLGDGHLDAILAEVEF